jgi:hypothetical protein
MFNDTNNVGGEMLRRLSLIFTEAELDIKIRRRDDAWRNNDQSRFKFLQKYSQMRRKLAGLQRVYGSKTFTAKNP